MPHQCVRCNTIFDDGAQEIVRGCSCGGKLFFYIKKDKLARAKQLVEEIKLSAEDRIQMEKDVFELVGQEIDRDNPVILDIEAIRVLKPGKYELDLVHLFNNEPLIFKLEEGKYMIDLVQSFKKYGKGN